MRPVLSLVGQMALLTWLTGSRVWAAKPDDLQRYFAEARESGTSEWARIQLRTVASITTGGSILSFAKSAQGEYYPSYQSASCPAGLDSMAVRQWQSESRQRIEPEVARLRLISDSDSSGFVSSAEANAFRELIEFGYFVDALIKGGEDLDEVVRARRMTLEEVRERVRRYNVDASRINGQRPQSALVLLPVLAIE